MMSFVKYNRYGLNEASRQRRWDAQTWRCPLASLSGAEEVWESGTSWQNAPHTSALQREGKHTHVHTSDSIVFPSCGPPLAPCHPLWSGVTAHEWGVNPGRIFSLAPWSGSTLGLTQCFWELPGAAKRDGWAAGHRLVTRLRWLMS